MPLPPPSYPLHRLPAATGRFGTLWLLLIALGACTSSVSLKVETDVPDPLIERLPKHVGVYYEDGFRNHIYVENTEERPNWNIATGTSQVALFDRLLTALFAGVVPMEHIYDGRTAVDGVIAPHIDEIQLATPDETMQDFYEAWIKYTVSVYDAEGELLTAWPMTAYGRARAGRFTSHQTGLNEAIASALRDAGAKFAIGFLRDPGVQKWLAEN